MSPATLDHLTQFTGQLFDALVKLATIAAPILLAYLAYRAKLAADAVHEVKQTLSEATGRTDQQYGVIHDFLNHERRVLLEKWAKSERQKASITGRLEDLHSAADAEQALREHDAGQKRIDDKGAGQANGGRA